MNYTLWEEVFGSGYEEVSDWIVGERFTSGDWETPGKVLISYQDRHGVICKKELTPDDLNKAYDKVVNYRHCGNTVGEQDIDACAADIILQMALQGGVIYG